ncbi:MAG: (2Fe-2S)-binding protein [Planctomycetaceae bacterium]
MQHSTGSGIVELDDKLCYCFHVTQRKVVNYIRVHRPQVASQLSECGGAGTGCGWCVPFLRKCFEAGTFEAGTEVQSVADELTAEEYAARRSAYIAAGKTRGQAEP